VRHDRGGSGSQSAGRWRRGAGSRRRNRAVGRGGGDGWANRRNGNRRRLRWAGRSGFAEGRGAGQRRPHVHRPTWRRARAAARATAWARRRGKGGGSWATGGTGRGGRRGRVGRGGPVAGYGSGTGGGVRGRATGGGGARHANGLCGLTQKTPKKRARPGNKANNPWEKAVTVAGPGGGWPKARRAQGRK
jgi:hypothetical protein